MTRPKLLLYKVFSIFSSCKFFLGSLSSVDIYERRNAMKCPICSDSAQVEIDMHSDGYADNLLECANCGAVWIIDCGEIILLNKKVACGRRMPMYWYKEIAERRVRDSLVP